MSAKEEFSDNPDHNILELCNILVQVWFATSKAVAIDTIPSKLMEMASKFSATIFSIENIFFSR